jgi:hypothetical protein
MKKNSKKKKKSFASPTFITLFTHLHDVTVNGTAQLCRNSSSSSSSHPTATTTTATTTAATTLIAV